MPCGACARSGRRSNTTVLRIGAHPDSAASRPGITASWSAGVEYDILLGENAGILTPRLDWNYQSEINFNTDPVFGFQEGYHLLNARMTWLAPGENWNVSLYVLNLIDKYYFHGKLSLVGNLGREQGNPAAPREWGLTVRRTF